MRQVQIPRYGPPEVLTVVESKDPEPKAGEARVRVQAAGINFADIAARMGLYPDAPPPPMVVGYEVAGKVDALGAGTEASGLKIGDDVIAMTRFGGYSDVVCAPASGVLKRPAGMSAETGAALPVVYLTAWHAMVVVGGLKRGERVLIHSAGGGVGTAAIQIAKIVGAETIGTASAAKHEALKKMGLDHAIDYTREDFEPAVKRITGGKGVHIILDPVGGDSWRKGMRLLAPNGRLCAFGYSEMTKGRRTRSILKVLKEFIFLPRVSPLALMDANTGVYGVNMGHLWDEVAMLRAELVDILAHVEAGRLAPVVDRVFPFAEAPAAHGFIQARKNLGKVLLRPV